MHAAGILRHIAADGTGDLAGRIRRVIEAVCFDRIGNGEIGDARLGDNAAVVIIDFKNFVELAKAEQHTIGERQRPARERGARSARHHIDPFGLAVFQDFGDFRNGGGQHRDHWQLAIGAEAVAFEGTEIVLVVDHAFRIGNDAPEARHQRVSLGEHIGIWLRH